MLYPLGALAFEITWVKDIPHLQAAGTDQVFSIVFFKTSIITIPAAARHDAMINAGNIRLISFAATFL